MEITRVFTEEIEEKMSEYELFNSDFDTVIVARKDGEIVAFLEEENGTVYAIESKQKGAGKALVDYLKMELDQIQVTNSGKDSWGFWEKMGFTQTSKSSYYAEWEWKY